MNRIIAMTSEAVSIGTDDGSIIEVRPEDVTFDARVGDVVTLFRNEQKIIVTKAEQQNSAASTGASQHGDGNNISVNVVNSAPSPSPAYVQTGKVVNKVTYALFAFFLGGIGAHKFYAGKVSMGILYLVFCWTLIPSIIALIEGIVALTKPADANGNIII